MRRTEPIGTLFWGVGGYIMAVLLLIVSSAITTDGGNPPIPVSVQVAMISGAGISLIGLLGTLVAYYFSRTRETTEVVRAIFEDALGGARLTPKPPRD